MQLRLRDPQYTERLASFLASLGQHPVTNGPDCLELDPTQTDGERVELEIYLRVWKVLYPDADVELAC